MKSYRIEDTTPTISRPIVFILIFSALITGNLWLLYAQAHNTLQNNNNWVSSKSLMKKYLIGSEEFVQSHRTLAFNRLDLSAWYGYQEIISKQAYPITTLDFDIKLSDTSYIYVIVNKTPGQFSAIRFSNYPEYPNAIITAKESGEFISASPITIPSFASNIWYHITIRRDPQNSFAEILINNTSSLSTSFKLLPIQRFGFRGSYFDTAIDNVKVRDAKSGLVFTDNFSYNTVYTPVIIINLYLCILLLTWFIFFYFYQNETRNVNYKKLLLRSTVSLLTILMTINGIYFYIRTMYPDTIRFINKVRVMMRLDQETNSNNWEENANDALLKSQGSPDPGVQYILFIGTSQTWGAGAQNENETFVNVFETQLNAQQPNGEKITQAYKVLNSSIPGSTSSMLLNMYKKHWIRYKPSMVIINLSNNDTDEILFRNNLKEFVNLNNQNNSKTMFVLEANSPEKTPSDLRMHATMRHVANENNVPVLDLHNQLKDSTSTGIIWWDDVHLTSYGHGVTGKILFESAMEMLK